MEVEVVQDIYRAEATESICLPDHKSFVAENKPGLLKSICCR